MKPKGLYDSGKEIEKMNLFFKTIKPIRDYRIKLYERCVPSYNINVSSKRIESIYDPEFIAFDNYLDSIEEIILHEIFKSGVKK